MLFLSAYSIWVSALASCVIKLSQACTSCRVWLGVVVFLVKINGVLTPFYEKQG